MSDRIWRNGTKSSNTLAKLTRNTFGLYPYIFQETCDYGRIQANAKLIKGQRFPLVDWITVKMIETAIIELNEVGSLLLWSQNGKRYGYFVGWEGGSGKFLTKRRKSPYPEPPADLLAKFLEDNNRFQALPTTSNDFPKGKERKGKERKTNERKEYSLVELFNSTCVSLSKVKTVSQSRKDKIKIRLTEHPDLDWWGDVFRKIEESPFLRGEKGWRASFDWLIENDRNAVKVIEGQYDQKSPTSWRDKYKHDKG